MPSEYRTVHTSTLDESVVDLAHLYLAHARDKANGTHEAPDFHDAVRLHELIDQISITSDTFPG